MARNSKTDNQELDLLKPVDFKIIGSKFDPCFGKSYDLTTPECKRCGDNETCCIAFMNTDLADHRKIEEDKRKFKDIPVAITQSDIKANSGTTLNDNDLKDIVRYFKKHMKKEVPRIKSINMAVKKFSQDKEELRKIYKSLKQK